MKTILATLIILGSLSGIIYDAKVNAAEIEKKSPPPKDLSDTQRKQLYRAYADYVAAQASADKLKIELDKVQAEMKAFCGGEIQEAADRDIHCKPEPPKEAKK
jgi:hypothetical protein